MKLLDSKTREKLEHKLKIEYCFAPRSQRWISVPGNCRLYNIEKQWNEEQQQLINSFFIDLVIDEIVMLVWEESCTEYSLLEDEFPQLCVDNNCSMIFDQKLRFGVFINPSRNEVAVVGRDLCDRFDKYREQLGLRDIDATDTRKESS